MLVTWEIEVDATTPLEAAKMALEIQRDPDGIATVFAIFEKNGDGEKHVIDLEEETNMQTKPNIDLRMTESTIHYGKSEDNTMKHTPGPLRTNGLRLEYGQIVAGDGFHLATVDPAPFGGDAQANADRLVACWNACAGINPEAVPELLGALQAARDDITDPNRGPSGSQRALESIDAAISQSNQCLTAPTS